MSAAPDAGGQRLPADEHGWLPAHYADAVGEEEQSIAARMW
jgi:hypothetical protein